MFWSWLADMPDRPLRMLPASLPESLFLKRAGGAKSSAVKVPDFLNACLETVRTRVSMSWTRNTYGLGIMESSSKDEAIGT
jgi:hypothetical protein